MKSAIQFYLGLYKRFGLRSIFFLLQSKFRTNKTDQLRIRGIKYPVTLSNFECDVTTLFQIFFAREYSIKMTTRADVILDCGANIGLSAVWYANTYPNAKIIAIEPDANNFVFLKKNTEAYPNVTCLNKAVWPYETSMSIVDKGTGNWSLQTIESKTKTGNDIDAVSISTLMDQFQINFIDILKIDIEGAEKELFSKNYEPWLSKTGIVAIELHDNIDKTISEVFYNAISQRKYKGYYNGENLICDFR